MDERRRYSRKLAEAALLYHKERSKGFTDELTGLGNRRFLDDQLPHLFALAERQDIPLAIAYGDVRGLKRTNDYVGHHAGDNLIKAAGETFQEIIRESDLAVHPSGDEFIAVLLGYTPNPGQTQEELDQETVQRLSSSFAKAVTEHGIPPELGVGIDMGIVCRQEGDTPQTLLTRAERLMAERKETAYQSNGIVRDDPRLGLH